MANLGPVYYPFSIVPSTSNANVYPYDIVINTVYPGLIFDASEAGATYAVIREVVGCLWFVVNADFDETTLEWTQEDPTNPNIPAYAMEMCQAGTWNWKYGPPTLIPGTPIVWQEFFEIDANGSVISTPPVVLASGDPSQQVNLTWDAGSATVVVARQIDVTNTSSSVNSLLDNFIVNTVQVWAVNEEGVLVAGDIPYARITGAPIPPSFNNPTFTGTSTFTGPVVMDSTLSVAGAVTMTDGLSVTGAPTDLFQLNVSTGATISGGLTVPNGETVTGGLTTDSLGVTGNTSIGGSLGVNGNTQLANVTLNAGDSITVNGTTPVVTLTSPDNSIAIVQDTPSSYQLEVSSTNPHMGATYATAVNFSPPATTGSITLPALPGLASDNFLIICSGSLQFLDSSKTLTLTGTGAGVTWPNSPQQYQNGAAANFPFTFYGTAIGGSSPSVTWTCNDQLAFTPMTMVMVAYFQ